MPSKLASVANSRESTFGQRHNGGEPSKCVVAEVTEMAVPNVGAGGGEGCGGSGWRLGMVKGQSGLELLNLAITVLVRMSFTEKPKGSNSAEHQLSITKRRRNIRFLIISVEQRMSRSVKERLGDVG